MKATQRNITGETLAAVRSFVTADDPLLAGRLRTASSDTLGVGFSQLFDAATAGDVKGAATYRLALESIFEGYLLHYGASRIFKPGTPEQDLLAGDYMYAQGLVSIAGLDDLDSIRMLAGLINICAFVHCGELNATAAMDAWSVVTLCLAGHTGASGLPGSPVRRVATLRNHFWNHGDAPADCLEEILTVWPASAGARLRQVIRDIYSSLEGYFKYQPPGGKSCL